MSEVFLGYVTNLQEATAFGISTRGEGDLVSSFSRNMLLGQVNKRRHPAHAR